MKLVGSTRPSPPLWRRKEKAKMRYTKKVAIKQAEKNVESKIAKYTEVLKQYGVLV